MELDANDNVLKHYTIADELIGFEYDSADYCYVNNGHGDVAFVTDGTGAIVNTYSYTAYGTALICDEKVSNAFRYTGECYDSESGLYYLRARYMNPETGTFTQEDTYQGNIYDALSLHKYLYAQDNPVIYKDPTGNAISLVEHLIAAGQWVVDFAKELWKLKTYCKFAKAIFIAQIVSLTTQIKDLLLADKPADWIESFSGLIITIIGVLELDVSNFISYLSDGFSILMDLVHLIDDIKEKKRTNIIQDFVSLGVDIVALICGILKIKFDEKAMADFKRSLVRTGPQEALIFLTKDFKNHGCIDDEFAGLLLKGAEMLGNWDDIWIVLFNS